MKRKVPEPASNTSNYRKESDLGQGAYGKVYLGEDRRTGEKVAIKEIREEYSSGGVSPSMYHEILALQRLKHPYIVKYY